MDVLEIQDWYHDRTRPGCKIDGLQKHAGNIPTGNGYQGQHNKFICTVDELSAQFENVFNSPDEKETTIADLSAMLASTVFVYGDQNLLTQFESARNVLTPNAARKEVAIDILNSDVEKYKFIPDERYDEIFYAKTDLFRYPSLLVHGLKVCYSMVSPTSHELVDELSLKELISPSLKHSLLFLLSTSQFVRLSSYIHHGSQKDYISVLSHSQQTETGDGLKDPWVIPSEIMLHMSIHLFTVKRHLVALRDDFTVLLEPLTYDVAQASAMVYYHTNQFSKFFSVIKEIDFISLHEFDQFRFKLMHCRVLNSTGNFLEAAELMEAIFSTYSTTENSIYFLLNDAKAFRHNLKGGVALMNGNYTEAIEQCHMSICLYTSVHKKHPDLAGAYLNLANALSCLEKFDDAEKAFLSSLQMFKNMYGVNANHERIASVYSCVGYNYFFNNKYTEAEKYFLNAVDMFLKLDHQNLNKSAISTCYVSLANIKFQQGKYEESILYRQKAKDIFSANSPC